MQNGTEFSSSDGASSQEQFCDSVSPWTRTFRTRRSYRYYRGRATVTYTCVIPESQVRPGSVPPADRAEDSHCERGEVRFLSHFLLRRKNFILLMNFESQILPRWLEAGEAPNSQRSVSSASEFQFHIEFFSYCGIILYFVNNKSIFQRLFFSLDIDVEHCANAEAALLWKSDRSK